LANIDLDSSEGRKSYLTEKLNDLIKGINENYGTVLLDELVNRLEITIRDFNDEMKDLCDKLVNKEKERQQILDLIKTGDSAIDISDEKEVKDQTNGSDVVDDTNLKSEELPSEEELTEWEKKLSQLENGE